MFTNAVAIASVVIKELYRRKDFYVLFVLTALITLLMGTMNFFSEDRVVRFLKEICLLLIWISGLVIAVTVAARQIPSEREQRTIFPLLAKPVSRWDILVGKFLGAWLATGLALLMFYVFFGLTSASREHSWPLLSHFQGFWLHWMMLGILISLTLLASLVFAAPSSSVTIVIIFSLGILLLGRHLNKIALQLAEPFRSTVYAIYFAIPHLEIFDIRDLIVHNWGLVPWGAFFLATAYALGYVLFFLGAGWLVFRRKPLN
jgi:ABC-type transport system involved in multi-copper enzyme maturation permease subunit